MNKKYTILLLGSGGREHAFAWKINQSSLCNKLFVAPGNAGTSEIAENVNLSINDFESIGKFSLKNNIDFILVGPEEPLVKGIKNYFLENITLNHIPVIGPDKFGAMLEGSKDFAKEFMIKYKIPTALYHTFTPQNISEGISHIKNQTLPIVLKADGLAAGKGVIIAQSHKEAEDALKNMLGGQFGEAGNKVVIEDFLKGIEVSVFVLTDGENYLILPEAKDYKRIGKADTGLNTGGMGAVSPVPFVNEEFLKKIENNIIIPTIDGIKKEKIDYTGFIFFGLINVDGEPFVIEYNCRMGDPETEAVMPRLENDFIELLVAITKKDLKNHIIKINPQTATTVVLVAGGYPADYEKGKIIDNLKNVPDVLVFHSGTKRNEKNEIVTNGGRVLALTALGNNLEEALQKANNAAQIINWEQKYFRKDIGFDLITT